MDWEAIPPQIAGIEDTQALTDARQLAIDAVGIRGLRHPVTVADGDDVQHTVATVRLAVELPPERRGAHLSRFVALLMEQRSPLSVESLPAFLADMAARLDAHAAEAEFVFPFFLEKHAPVSGVAGYLDYEVRLFGRLAGGQTAVETGVTVPVTSLCPCSREISRYGAHNQRAHIRVAVRTNAPMSLAELIGTIEAEASAPLYSLLKRADEKYLTERAYENPKFVEDTVRDVALRLRSDGRVRSFQVEAENFESIHNHSAYAVISG
ncbi:MAG: GTP cyclohydrolase FolE2 [Gammaproteobacteria bacterium]